AYLLWNGPLARLGVQDYAGSLGVHAVGGIVGLVGASFLGKRSTSHPAHDIPMMGLGALLLMFSWFGFNLGSVPSYGNIAADLPLVAIRTLAAIVYGIVSAYRVFWVVKAVTGLRVNEDEELAGLDIAEHGMAAYPELLNIGVAITSPPPLHVLSGIRVADVMNEVVCVSPYDTL